MDADGFTIVTRRKSKKKTSSSYNNKRKNKKRDSFMNIIDHSIDIDIADDGDGDGVDAIERCYNAVNACVTSLKTSSFYAAFRDLVNHNIFQSDSYNDSNVITSSNEWIVSGERVEFTACNVMDVFCYGVGSFMSSPIARLQLSLCLLLCSQLGLSNERMHIFEPLMTSIERSVILRYGVSVITTNEECKRRACGKSVFFMPHCSRQLYNNLLWANWSHSQLHSAVIIGNSFSSYDIRFPTHVLQSKASFLARALSLAIEVALPHHLFDRNDTFNDTSIHVFPHSLLSNIKDEEWNDVEEPIADLNDPEFMAASIIS